ncbi:MAG: hypothetical protein CSA38_02000 [Flavobacteriales bacterium]|nr:MAG: hypothetical protein CSA38_02000 [Flavobacteriales bacterium]
MIDNLESLIDLVKEELVKNKIHVERIKKTVSGSSAYFYTSKGCIRLSDHHNKHSFDKCICAITIPTTKIIVEKIISRINELYNKC